jgi:hypothetical protein
MNDGTAAAAGQQDDASWRIELELTLGSAGEKDRPPMLSGHRYSASRANAFTRMRNAQGR